MTIVKCGILGGRGRAVLIELLRSWQLSRKKREGGLYWPGPPQLSVHRSQWKFIYPIGHISFRIRLDSMLKLIRNYINPIRLTVRVWKRLIYAFSMRIFWVALPYDALHSLLSINRLIPRFCYFHHNILILLLIFFAIFFGGLECVGHSYAYIAQNWVMSGVEPRVLP